MKSNMRSGTSGNEAFSFAPVGAASNSWRRSDTSCSAGRAVPSRREGGRIIIRHGDFRLSGAGGAAQDSSGKRDDGEEKLQDPADCDARSEERRVGKGGRG